MHITTNNSNVISRYYSIYLVLLLYFIFYDETYYFQLAMVRCESVFSIIFLISVCYIDICHCYDMKNQLH